ncbi:MAG: hypothetical protein EBR47_13615, partial [Betaproteobacteria bacterium]|nr:hypothetical protein [Betaproteobacteria bacterium]
ASQNAPQAIKTEAVRGKAGRAAASAQKAAIAVSPADDVRLTANIRKDLHLKLKIAAAESRTTIGEIIEALVARHLDKDMPAIVQAIEKAREVQA